MRSGDGLITISYAADTTAPVITPTVGGTLGQNGWYTSDVTVTWGVSDPESTVTMTSWGCYDQSVTSDTAGVTFTCEATSAGGTGTQSVTVKRDATAPTLKPSVSPNPVLLNGTATAAPNASDALSGLASSSCAPVTTSTVGPQSVSCTATDNAGNTASQAASYTVAYPFSGFLQPVDNLPTLNTVKAGSSIPIKFSLRGNRGLNILAAGSPGVKVVPCDGSAPADEIEQTLTTSNSTLSYDAASDTYSYTWKTDKSWAGTCRQLNVLLSDGTSHLASFKFR